MLMALAILQKSPPSWFLDLWAITEHSISQFWITAEQAMFGSSWGLGSGLAGWVTPDTLVNLSPVTIPLADANYSKSL